MPKSREIAKTLLIGKVISSLYAAPWLSKVPLEAKMEIADSGSEIVYVTLLP